jgi:hypothetical protein
MLSLLMLLATAQPVADIPSDATWTTSEDLAGYSRLGVGPRLMTGPGLELVCRRGSRRLLIIVRAGSAPGAQVPVSITSQSTVSQVQGRRDLHPHGGETMLIAELASDDAAVMTFRSSGQIAVQAAGATVAKPPTAPVRLAEHFLASCG